jgi:hypothetical protein
MIVIGADIHKSSHALAAVNATTGVIVGELEVKARESGHLGALRCARSLDGDRVWAIEDCRHLSRHVEEALLAAGERGQSPAEDDGCLASRGTRAGEVRSDRRASRRASRGT